MNVPPLNAALPAANLSGASLSAPAPTATSPAPAVSADSLTQQIAPPRFPWLTRLSLALEQAAAEKRRVFRDAPALGDHLDASA